MATTERIYIACELLEQALRLYAERRAYHACLHLAEAAGEVFSAYVVFHGGQSSLDGRAETEPSPGAALSAQAVTLRETVIANLVNARSLRPPLHGRSDGDVAAEARAVLDRAIANFNRLRRMYPLPEIPLVGEFRKPPQR